MKKQKLSTLKNKLWEIISKYVRLKYADDNGYVQCVTCGKVKHYKDQMQAGHFIPQAKGNGVRYDLRNIHPQCSYCNGPLGSNPAEYFRFMQNKYGDEVIDELRCISKIPKPLKVGEVLDLIDEFKDLLRIEQERVK